MPADNRLPVQENSLEAENARLRALYENVTSNRERFGWTINHLLECEEALRIAECDNARLREAMEQAAAALRRPGDQHPSVAGQILREALEASA